MIYFRACPKCFGDLADNKDRYGQYTECLQCGLLIDKKVKDGNVRVSASSR